MSGLLIAITLKELVCPGMTGWKSISAELGVVASRSFLGAEGAVAARAFCERFKQAAKERSSEIFDRSQLFEGLCQAQPNVVLDTFFGGDNDEWRIAARMMNRFRRRKSPLDAIPASVVVAWCDHDPAVRYARAAGMVSYLRGSEEEGPSQWSDLALQLMRRAPEPAIVVKAFVERFHPLGWSGSLATVLEGRRRLLTELEQEADTRLVEVAKTEGELFDSAIAAQRTQEAADERRTDQRFE